MRRCATAPTRSANRLEIEIAKTDGKAPSRNGFVTDLDAARDTAACGRARWKAENETFGVLKTHSYNFDHGRETLASMPGALHLPGLRHVHRQQPHRNRMAPRAP